MIGHHWMRGDLDLDRKPAKPVTRAMLRRVGRYFRPYWKQTAVVVLTLAVTAGLGVVPPFLAKAVIDQAIARGEGGLLNLLVIAMVVVPIAGGLIGVGTTYLNASIGQRVMFDLRNELYASLRRQGMRFFTHTKAGELVSRVNNDVSGIETVVTGTIAGLVQNTFVVSWTLGMMFSLDWKLTALSLAILPLFVYPTRRVGRIRRDLARRRQQRVARMSSLVEETLGVSGALLVKTFGRDRYEIDRFSDENRQLMGIQIRESMVGRWFFMIIQVFWSAAPALVWFYGGHRAISDAASEASNAFTVGSVVAFTALQTRMFMPVNQLLTVHVDVQAALALFERIFEYLDLVPDVRERPGAIPLARAEGRVAFDRVSFAYREDSPVLHGVSFEVPPGRMTALVGPSGGGKSTIAALVSRLYDPDSGAVTLDRRDLRDLTLESVASAVGVVSQDPFLFHASIRDNLLYARPGASDADVVAAARAAQIHEFVAGLPDGYETLVGERGYRLSGGEKQRVAIARAILKDPRVLVLDEATSALDSRAERLIQRALAELLRGRTAIVIAHRLSTVLAAGEILVVDGGRIVERGPHEKLLARGELYSRLYREQFSAAGRLADAPS
ncbi:MAG: ABC transporter ATP-binding protein [Acidobacteria bacterium]|nr:ABC transporter ATP-binding protein [Acidobacteriota bacterium]